MRTWMGVVVAVVVGAGLGACSSDGDPEVTAATSSAADVCASADGLRVSLTALGDVQIVQQGVDAVQDAWTTVQDDWAQLAADAGDRYADQVDGVQGDADAVDAAVATAAADPSAQTLGAAATAIGLFLQNADALVDEVRSTC